MYLIKTSRAYTGRNSKATIYQSLQKARKIIRGAAITLAASVGCAPKFDNIDMPSPVSEMFEKGDMGYDGIMDMTPKSTDEKMAEPETRQSK